MEITQREGISPCFPPPPHPVLSVLQLILIYCLCISDICLTSDNPLGINKSLRSDRLISLFNTARRCLLCDSSGRNQSGHAGQAVDDGWCWWCCNHTMQVCESFKGISWADMQKNLCGNCSLNPDIGQRARETGEVSGLTRGEGDSSESLTSSFSLPLSSHNDCHTDSGWDPVDVCGQLTRDIERVNKAGGGEWPGNTIRQFTLNDWERMTLFPTVCC